LQKVLKNIAMAEFGERMMGTANLIWSSSKPRFIITL